MEAVVCNISQDILGMDFLDKYKMGMEWDDYDQSELFLVDKRAKIKTRLEMVTVPTDLQRVHYLEDIPTGSSLREESLSLESSSMQRVSIPC